MNLKALQNRTIHLIGSLGEGQSEPDYHDDDHDDDDDDDNDVLMKGFGTALLALSPLKSPRSRSLGPPTFLMMMMMMMMMMIVMMMIIKIVIMMMMTNDFRSLREWRLFDISIPGRVKTESKRVFFVKTVRCNNFDNAFLQHQIAKCHRRLQRWYVTIRLADQCRWTTIEITGWLTPKPLNPMVLLGTIEIFQR